MSSTIKQAIQALKGRIADAYTAVSAKGGTLPATQDSTNLPTAIASIPSGGGMDASDFTPTPSGKLADYLTSGYLQTTQAAIYSYTLGMASLLRGEVIVNDPTQTQSGEINSSSITIIRFPYLKGKAGRFAFSAATQIHTPVLETVSGSDIIFNRCNALTEVNCPSLILINSSTVLLANSALVTKIYMPNLTQCYGRICYGGDERRVEDIEVGAMTTNLNTYWRPYAYYNDAAKMAEINANIRNHIAAKVADGGGTLTFYVRSEFYAYLEQATLDAFAAKHWIVAGN